MYGPILEGKLVRLRPPQPADAAVMITWFDDLEVTRFLKLQNPPSLDAEKEWLDRMARDPDSVFWVVEHVGRVVGGTSIVRIDWKHGFGTTGTVLGDKSVWGKGLGRELMQLRADYAFTQTPLRKRKSKVALLTDYRGLTVTQLQELRGKLRTGDVEYRVVKNTLARRAADAAGVADLKAELEGPVAIAFGYDDLSLPSKLINEFVRTTRLKLDVKGGLVEGRVFSPDQVKQLADLPSRDSLLAQLLGTLQSPVAQLVGIMQTPVQQLLGVLDAYKSKLEAA